MIYTLPKLSYSYNALEPFIDARTMEIHHTKHHQAYIDKLNGVLKKNPAIADVPLEELMATLDTLDISDADKKIVRNHGGGHLNHTFFWNVLGTKKNRSEKLETEIIETFGSVEKMKEAFTNAAVTQFGSGWAWLVRSKGSLKIYSTPNQDSPFLHGDAPLLGLDVWEHAYYLSYQNRRADYVAAWWNVCTLI